MDHTLIQKAIDGVPQTEEERLIVMKWAISLVKDSDNQDLPKVGDSEKETDVSKELPQSGSQPVSEKRSGSSIHDRPVKDRESTISPGWLASKGSTASLGRPKVVVTTQHTCTKDAAAKPACKDIHQQEELENLPLKR